ncbi:hypothetical protein B0H16DRAFT_1459168 [Mycena metata]|uniref:Uncharacterized protein n=1 Tax=Mycena metata TaxID=1033252 RepID=A0AAD7NBS5_9AGAR|nr:hypothetical protein B0H16DRAFT_1459168 [Mycena metata]
MKAALPRHAFAPIPIDVVLSKGPGMPIAVLYYPLRRMIPAATSSPLESAGNAVVSRVLSDSIRQPAQWHPSTLAHEIVQRQRAQRNPGGIPPIFLLSNGLQLKKMIIPVFENQANWVVRDQTTKEPKIEKAGRNRVRATHTVLKSDGKKFSLAQEEEDVLSEKDSYDDIQPSSLTFQSLAGCGQANSFFFDSDSRCRITDWTLLQTSSMIILRDTRLCGIRPIILRAEGLRGGGERVESDQGSGDGDQRVADWGKREKAGTGAVRPPGVGEEKDSKEEKGEGGATTVGPMCTENEKSDAKIRRNRPNWRRREMAPYGKVEVPVPKCGLIRT